MKYFSQLLIIGDRQDVLEFFFCKAGDKRLDAPHHTTGVDFARFKI